MREEPAGCRQWGGREAGEEGAPLGLGASRRAGLVRPTLLPQLPSLNLPLTGFCFLTRCWPNSTVLEQSTPWVTGTLLPKPQLTTGGQACESLGSQPGAPGDEEAGTCLQGPCTQCPPSGRPEQEPPPEGTSREAGGSDRCPWCCPEPTGAREIQGRK